MVEEWVPLRWIGVRSEHAQAIYEAFEDLLTDLPMSQTELASQIGVAHTTVGRWARGQTRPSLDHMIRAVNAIAERLEDLRRRVERTGSALQAVRATQQAWESGDLHEVAIASQRVGEILDEG